MNSKHQLLAQMSRFSPCPTRVTGYKWPAPWKAQRPWPTLSRPWQCPALPSPHPVIKKNSQFFFFFIVLNYEQNITGDCKGCLLRGHVMPHHHPYQFMKGPICLSRTTLQCSGDSEIKRYVSYLLNVTRSIFELVRIGQLKTMTLDLELNMNTLRCSSYSQPTLPGSTPSHALSFGWNKAQLLISKGSLERSCCSLSRQDIKTRLAKGRRNTLLTEKYFGVLAFEYLGAVSNGFTLNDRQQCIGHIWKNW